MTDCDCCTAQRPGTDLVAVEEAREILLAGGQRLVRTETVGLAQMLGRTLAQDLVSPIDVPGHDNSAMDGYAVRAADVATAPVVLPVSQRIAAGGVGQSLERGTVARIFTGAPMPNGADAVVMQEHCELVDAGVRINHAAAPGENVRPRGNDVAEGESVMRRGTRLGPQAIGVIASLGLDRLAVTAKPVVALFSTGDELAEPGQALRAGAIYNSNRYAIRALLEVAGCETLDLGRVPDEREATRKALRAGALEADLVLSTGGVSVGEEDHVRSVLELDGALQLWRIRVKPGKPLAFGRLLDTPFIGLPGNPISAFVTYLLFARPFLRRLQGQASAFPAPQWVRFDGDWPKARPRREFLRVCLREAEDGGLPWAVPVSKQGSDVLSATLVADGLAEVPEERRHASGTRLRYWPFETLMA